MTNMRRTVFRGVAAVGALLLVVGGAYAARLILPGRPESGRVAVFAGFVMLPKSSAVVNFQDYMLVDGTSLYVAGGSSVQRVALHGTALPGAGDIESFSLPAPTPATHGVAIDPVGKLVYVTHSEANTVDVFDPQTRQAVKRIPVADDCDAIFYDPASRLIYVASGDAQVATLIDPSTRALVGTIPLGARPEYGAVDVRGGLLYQNLPSINAVAALDLAKKTIVQRWALDDCDQPAPMAIDAADRLLFIGCSRNAKLKVFDLGAHRVIASVDVGNFPDSVVYDPGTRRIFVTGGSGLMSVIEQDTPASYRVVDSLHTHLGAHTLAYDPVGRTLFVAYAAIAVAPRLAMFTVAAR